MPRVTRIEQKDRPQAQSAKVAQTAPRSAPIDERALVRQAQKGDKVAFETLVQRHQHRLFAVARGILKRHEDVEDIAQQVFVKAYFSLKRFDQRAAFSTWLYKITVNECWDLLRRKKSRPLIYEADFSEEQSRQYSAPERELSRTPDTSDRMAMRERLDTMLGQLDQRDRAIDPPGHGRTEHAAAGLSGASVCTRCHCQGCRFRTHPGCVARGARCQ